MAEMVVGREGFRGDYSAGNRVCICVCLCEYLCICACCFSRIRWTGGGVGDGGRGCLLFQSNELVYARAGNVGDLL